MLQSYITEMIEKSDISLRARGKIHHCAGYTVQRHISDFDVLYTVSGKHYFNENKPKINKNHYGKHSTGAFHATLPVRPTL